MYSFRENIREGNYWSAGLDAAGIAVDSVALALPVVPGGAGMGVIALRAADKVAALPAPRVAGLLEAPKSITPYFPKNNGFLGGVQNTVLKSGQIIDRFGGSEFSRFFSPQGVPSVMRALPPGSQSQMLRTFEVINPFEVQSGVIAPAFGQIGLGTQFRSEMQLGDLLNNNFLREITK
jgi:hypothetical protein